MTEAEVMNAVRRASRCPLWRNNVGAAIDASGRHIRYGLANDSKAMSATYKSADLIGINPVIVTPEMVGGMLGQFVSVEVKRSDWRGVRTDRERAQQKWADYIRDRGGLSSIVNSEKQFKELMGYEDDR